MSLVHVLVALNLAKELALKATSIVGTVNKVRREPPPSATLDNTKELHSTSILKDENYTLTIYMCKPTKNVVLLSSMDQSVSIRTDVKKIPETVACYNSTNFGVDVVDQMACKYTVKADRDVGRYKYFTIYLILPGSMRGSSTRR